MSNAYCVVIFKVSVKIEKSVNNPTMQSVFCFNNVKNFVEMALILDNLNAMMVI